MKYYAIKNSINISDAENAEELKKALTLNEDILVCKRYEDAVLIAKGTKIESEGHQFPIFEVQFKGTTGRHPETYVLTDGKELSKEIYSVNPEKTNNFEVLNASLAHVDAKYKAVDFTAKAAVVEEKKADEPAAKPEDKKADDAAKPEDKKADDAAKPEDKKADDAAKTEDKKAEDTAKNSSMTNYLAAATGVAVVSTGFWFSGLYPATTAILAKLGVSLPFAAMGVQVGVAVAVGVAVVAVASLSIYAFNSLFASEEKKAEEKKTEEKPDTRTADQKYHDDLKAKEEEVKSLSEKLVDKDDIDFKTKLHAILDVEHAEERKFKKDGNLIKNQPAANDKLIVLQYEAAKLAAVVNAQGKERAELEAKALEAAKADAAKKFAV